MSNGRIRGWIRRIWRCTLSIHAKSLGLVLSLSACPVRAEGPVKLGFLFAVLPGSLISGVKSVSFVLGSSQPSGGGPSFALHLKRMNHSSNICSSVAAGLISLRRWQLCLCWKYLVIFKVNVSSSLCLCPLSKHGEDCHNLQCGTCEQPPTVR